MKQANVIIYKPGYGGHFISMILSLSPSTIPWFRRGGLRTWIVPNDTTGEWHQWVHDLYNTNYSANDRASQISFKNIHTKFTSWDAHHMTYPYEVDLFKYFAKSEKYQTINFSVHPYGFYRQGEKEKILDIANANSIKLNFLQVQLSSKYEEVIDKFKIANNNFPVLRPGENDDDLRFTTEYSPFMINFDNFILGAPQFIVEYEKICAHLNLPTYHDIVLPLYRDWRIERGM